MDGPLSRYMASAAPQPTQAALERMLERVAKARVYAGGMNWDRPVESTVLAEVDFPEEIAELKQALRIVDGSGGHCMCDGDPTLELLDAQDRRVAVLGLHHGVSIRWCEWKDDARLAEGKGMELLTWLLGVGVPEPLDDFLEDAMQHEMAERAWDAWLGAMPTALRALPEATWRKVLEKGDVFPLLATLAKAYPDMAARALALLHWHAHGGLEWSNYPTYEDVSQALLAQFPEKELARIADTSELTQPQVCGAARFFACNEPSRPVRLPDVLGPTGEVVLIPERSTPLPPLSPALRARLLLSCMQGTDDDGRRRAEIAFLAAEDREFVAAVRAARSGPVMVLPSAVPFSHNAGPEALAAYLSAVDAVMPKGFEFLLRFRAEPAGEIAIMVGVAGDDAEQQARRQAVLEAGRGLPRFNSAKSALEFATWYTRPGTS